METFAVSLVGEEDRGWLVEAALAEETIDIVHGTLARAWEVWRSELLVGTEDYHRHRYLLGAPLAAIWTRL